MSQPGHDPFLRGFVGPELGDSGWVRSDIDLRLADGEILSSIATIPASADLLVVLFHFDWVELGWSHRHMLDVSRT